MSPHPIISHQISLRDILISSHLRIGLPSGFFPRRFSHQNSACISVSVPNGLGLTCPRLSNLKFVYCWKYFFFIYNIHFAAPSALLQGWQHHLYLLSPARPLFNAKLLNFFPLDRLNAIFGHVLRIIFFCSYTVRNNKFVWTFRRDFLASSTGWM